MNRTIHAAILAVLLGITGCATPPAPQSPSDPLWPHRGWEAGEAVEIPAPFEAYYDPPRVLGASTSPSNVWLAATTGFASYRDADGWQLASYAQAVCWQPVPWGSVNMGALVPLDTPDRVTPEVSATLHWPPNADWSLEAGVYAAIGRAYSVPPYCFGGMIGFRKDTGLAP